MTVNFPQEAQLLNWWQRDDLHYQQGSLVFAGREVRGLTETFGTPSFVYSKQRAVQNLHRLHEALASAQLQGGYRLLYAMKANRFAPLLSFLKETDLCDIDACSPEEVKLAVACGFSPAQISFTAGSLSSKDFDQLAAYPGLGMTCDSIHAIREWGLRKPGTAIGVRINPAAGVSREENSQLQYAGTRTTKFGIYREQFAQALQVAQAHNVRIEKIHFHTGCGYLTEQLEQWDRVIDLCEWFIEQCPGLTTVNVGGGLGVPHLASDRALDLARWSAVLSKHFGQRAIKVEVEPGEYIMKDAGLLLLSKTYLEQKQQTWFLGVDAGFNIAPEPAYYQLPFLPVTLDELSDAQRTPVTVVGNINEALDVWYENALLPDMQDEPYLALINAGAYSASMASNHCMRGQFSEYLI